MSDDAAPMGEVTEAPDTDGGQEPTNETPSSAPSYEDRLNERLEQFSQQQQQQYEQLLSRFEQPEADDDDDPYPLSEDDDGYEDQEAQRILDDLVNERVQQALTPFQQQQAQQQIQRDFKDLQSRFPELQDDKVSGPIIERVSGLADTLGIDVNNPAIVGLIETFYKAQVADKHAQQETPAGGRRDVQLESGGGAAPADREENLEDRVLRAAQAASPRI